MSLAARKYGLMIFLDNAASLQTIVIVSQKEPGVPFKRQIGAVGREILSMNKWIDVSILVESLVYLIHALID